MRMWALAKVARPESVMAFANIMNDLTGMSVKFLDVPDVEDLSIGDK